MFFVLWCLVVGMWDVVLFLFFFFKQKTAYEMRISDWSSDVCSSDLIDARFGDDRRRIARILVIAGVEDGVARIVRDLVDRRRRRGDAIIMILQPAHIAPELFFDAFGRTLERDVRVLRLAVPFQHESLPHMRDVFPLDTILRSSPASPVSPDPARHIFYA